MERVKLEQLNILLASLNVLRQNAYAVHWLSIGNKFYDIHSECKAVYELAEGYSDITAELIVQRGEKPITSLQDMINISLIEEIDTLIDITPDEIDKMWVGLTEDISVIKKHLLEILAVMQDVDVYSTLINLVPSLNKILWMMSLFSE